MSPSRDTRERYDRAMGRLLRMRAGARRFAGAFGLDRHRTSPFAAQRRLLGAGFDGVVIDAGANVGQSARRYLRTFPNARIHSFEPHPRSFEILRSWGDGRPQITPYRLALGETRGSERLRAYANSRANSFLRLSDRAASYFPYLGGKEEPLDEIVVTTTTVDAFCEEAGIGTVGVLKLDVQGSELGVLRGAGALLDRAAIDLIYAELIFGELYEGQPGVEEILAFLGGRGYRVSGLFDLNYGANGMLLMADGLFVRPGMIPA